MIKYCYKINKNKSNNNKIKTFDNGKTDTDQTKK